MENDLLKRNEIYNRQLGMLIFCVMFVFKLTRLPRLLITEASGMILIPELILGIMDILIFIVVYIYIKMNGYELSQQYCKLPLKIMLFPLLLLFILKFTIYYSATVTYVASALFRSVIPFIIIITMILPIVYLAFKGIVPIARTVNIVFWFIVLFLAFDYAFLKGDPHFSNVLPFFNTDFSQFTSDMTKFGMSTGEMLPFLFIKLKNRKLPYVGIGITLSFLFLIFATVFAVAIFGGAIFTIENIFAVIPIFNEFSATLGKLEWAGIIPWFMMAIINLSCILWAIFEISGLYIKKRTVFVSIFTIVFIGYMCTVTTLERIIALGPTVWNGTLFWIGYTIIPLGLLILAIIAKRKSTQNLSPDTSDCLSSKNSESCEKLASQDQEKNNRKETQEDNEKKEIKQDKENDNQLQQNNGKTEITQDNSNKEDKKEMQSGKENNHKQKTTNISFAKESSKVLLEGPNEAQGTNFTVLIDSTKEKGGSNE